MLKSFADKNTEKVWLRQPVRKWDRKLRQTAYIKLIVLHAATSLEELRSPPGNRLEMLRGDRRGQHSIRVNRQFRICFRWTAAGVEDIELTDYH